MVRVVFSAIWSRQEPAGWYVFKGRRAGACRARYDERIAGPFDLREEARLTARDLRKRQCVQHEDCCQSWELSRACLASRVPWFKAEVEAFLAELAKNDEEEAAA